MCIAVKRIYVHESIYDKFKEAMVKAVKNYTIGDGLQPTSTHGPVQNSMQYERVKTFFNDIEKQGWKVATGGKVEPSSGYFISPTIIDKPADDSRIVVEEPFGEPSISSSSRLWLTSSHVQARLSLFSPGRTNRRSSTAPTTRPWVSELQSGVMTWPKPLALPNSFRLEMSGSTPIST